MHCFTVLGSEKWIGPLCGYWRTCLDLSGKDAQALVSIAFDLGGPRHRIFGIHMSVASSWRLCYAPQTAASISISAPTQPIINHLTIPIRIQPPRRALPSRERRHFETIIPRGTFSCATLNVVIIHQRSLLYSRRTAIQSISNTNDVDIGSAMEYLHIILPTERATNRGTRRNRRGENRAPKQCTCGASLARFRLRCRGPMSPVRWFRKAYGKVPFLRAI
jgi:hypothetical protein